MCACKTAKRARPGRDSLTGPLPPLERNIVDEIAASRDKLLEYLAQNTSQDIRRATSQLEQRALRIQALVQSASRQACWARDQAQGIEIRASQTSENLDRLVRENLQFAYSYLRAVQEEAQAVRDLLVESEARVLALMVQRDEQRLMQAVRNVSDRLEQYHDSLQELALSPSPGAASG